MPDVIRICLPEVRFNQEAGSNWQCERNKIECLLSVLHEDNIVGFLVECNLDSDSCYFSQYFLGECSIHDVAPVTYICVRGKWKCEMLCFLY